MAMSTFSFFLPLPFFAAAGGFGGAAAFGAFGTLFAFVGAPPAAPTRASVLLRSSMAASEARALMIVAGGSPCLWASYCSVARAACCDR